MKGVRFYEQATRKDGRWRGVSYIIAVYYAEDIFTVAGYSYCSATVVEPDLSIHHTDASVDHLKEHCHRISEDRARELCPKLFEYRYLTP